MCVCVCVRACACVCVCVCVCMYVCVCRWIGVHTPVTPLCWYFVWCQVHPKTKIEDQDELSSLLQVPIVVSAHRPLQYLA